jgi:hypothetical protein
MSPLLRGIFIVSIQVMGAVDVKHTEDHELTLEWDSSGSNDMIADSTLALITGIDKSPASVKCMRLLYSVMRTDLKRAP